MKLFRLENKQDRLKRRKTMLFITKARNNNRALTGVKESTATTTTLRVILFEFFVFALLFLECAAARAAAF